IGEGIAKLYAIRLDGHPAGDTLEGVEEVWVEALWYSHRDWQEDPDAERLRAAFRSIARTAERWPAPRALLDHLPPRPAPPALPQPEPDPDRARAWIQTLAEQLRATGSSTRG
ncbi:MAG: hypothetical protein ACLFTX_04505, partial [Thiohalospira sp.]